MADVKRMVCIVCPVGCRMSVRDADGKLEVTGNTCARGLAYAKEEAVNPLRMVTASARVSGGVMPVVSAKTAARVPKAHIAQVLSQIAQLQLQAPVHAGDILLENVAGSGVNVVATRSVDARKTAENPAI